MDVAIIGVGAIGGVIAAYLHQAGMKITLIGRSDQVDAIAQQGLKVSGVRGDVCVQLRCLKRLDREYPLVIFATKTQDLEQAYQENCDFLEHGLILTTHNGVQAENILSGHIEKEKIISSAVMFAATYTKPGEIVFNFEGPWVMGKPFTPNTMIVHDIATMMSKAFSVIVSDQMMGMKWLKLLIHFKDCIPALIGQSTQEAFFDRDLCRLHLRLLKEGVSIVRKANIDLVSLPGFSKERLEELVGLSEQKAVEILQPTLICSSDQPLYGSMLQSLLRKKRTEIDFINGEVDVLAKQMGTIAPLNHRIVDLMHMVEHRGRFFSVEEIKKEFEAQLF